MKKLYSVKDEAAYDAAFTAVVAKAEAAYAEYVTAFDAYDVAVAKAEAITVAVAISKAKADAAYAKYNAYVEEANSYYTTDTNSTKETNK
ncbi:MAG: hypothetical protein GY820_21205 [Gammaproteobacteria bacterium]|nr:hypothetical protein [Gammaproteobacteria bacterium]